MSERVLHEWISPNGDICRVRQPPHPSYPKMRDFCVAQRVWWTDSDGTRHWRPIDQTSAGDELARLAAELVETEETLLAAMSWLINKDGTPSVPELEKDLVVIRARQRREIRDFQRDMDEELAPRDTDNDFD